MRKAALILGGAIVLVWSGHFAWQTEARAATTPAPLAVVSGTATARTVVLARRTNGTLEGRLSLVLRNTTAKPARVVVTYLPTASGEAADSGSVAFLEGHSLSVGARSLGDVKLVFSLARDASPADLAGLLALQFRQAKALIGAPVVVPIAGAADALAGVKVVPATVTLKQTSWGGWLAEQKHATLNVQLRGPGVASLFGKGMEIPRPTAILRSAGGGELRAHIIRLVRSANPSVATGVVSIDGTFDPGAYTGTLALSDLSSTAPTLRLTLQSRHGFVWALLTALLGALIGGGAYLASNLRRRKNLLQANVRDLLKRYEGQVSALPQPSPLWTLDEYLGPRQNWYRIEWTAVPEVDGAEGIWAGIHWARNDADLDDATQEVTQLHDRISRWLKAASAVDTLLEVAELRPQDPPDHVWTATKTVGDTKLLLRRLRELEPPDDASTVALIARVRRQARWHAAFAHTWHMKSVVLADVAVDIGRSTDKDRRYTDNDRMALHEVNLDDVDSKAYPEERRTDEAQLDFEQQLDELEESLRSVYKGGELSNLELPGPERAVALASLSATEARPEQSAQLGMLPAFRPEPSTKTTVTRTEATTRAANAIEAILRRDLFWTVTSAVLATAVYVPTIYGPTWGAASDYGSAFVAGLAGKFVINWALLPAFQSLGLRRSATAAATQPAAQPAEAAVGVSGSE